MLAGKGLGEAGGWAFSLADVKSDVGENSYFELMSQTGLLSVILLVLFLFGLAKTGLEYSRKFHDPLLSPVFLAVAAHIFARCLSGIFSPSLFGVIPLASFFFLCGAGFTAAQRTMANPVAVARRVLILKAADNLTPAHGCQQLPNDGSCIRGRFSAFLHCLRFSRRADGSLSRLLALPLLRLRIAIIRPVQAGREITPRRTTSTRPLRDRRGGAAISRMDTAGIPWSYGVRILSNGRSTVRVATCAKTVPASPESGSVDIGFGAGWFLGALRAADSVPRTRSGGCSGRTAARKRVCGGQIRAGEFPSQWPTPGLITAFEVVEHLETPWNSFPGCAGNGHPAADLMLSVPDEHRWFLLGGREATRLAAQPHDSPGSAMALNLGLRHAWYATRACVAGTLHGTKNWPWP